LRNLRFQRRVEQARKDIREGKSISLEALREEAGREAQKDG